MSSRLSFLKSQLIAYKVQDLLTQCIQEKKPQVTDEAEYDANEQIEAGEAEPDEKSQAIATDLKKSAMASRIASDTQARLVECLVRLMERLVCQLGRSEQLLIQIDNHKYTERMNFCDLLRYIGDDIELRESQIKNYLRQISLKEMEKGQEEDALQKQTLQTIEVINIADMAMEKTNLERQVAQMQDKQVEL